MEPQVALIKAIVKEDEEATEQLLNTSMNINYVTPNGLTPLIAAIETYNNKFVTMVLEAGADPNLSTVYATPLTAAVDIAVEALKNDETVTALSNETIEILLKYGADILGRDSQGLTAYDFARGYNLSAQRLFERTLGIASS